MNKKKYIILGIVLILILGIGSTFAWYVWSSSDDEVKTISATLGAARVIYNEGSDIVSDIMPVATKEEGIIKEVTVKAVDNTSYNLTFNLYLDAIQLDDIFKHESFRYEIHKDGTKIKEGNFTETFKECTVNDTTHLVLVEGEKITTSKSTYTLYLWIDGVNYTNPSEMQRKTISLKLHASGENAILFDGSVVGPSNAVNFITALYDGVDKTEVTNNSIVYNYATDFSLMNDGLGFGNMEHWQAVGAPSQEVCYSTLDCSTGYSNMGFSDVASCEAGLPDFLQNEFGLSTVEQICGSATEGNIRYYGANPNNYIDIGDVFTEDTTVNGWQTIGWWYENEESCRNDWYEGSTIEAWCESNWENDGYSSYEECVTLENEWFYEETGLSSIDELCGTKTFSAGTTKSLYRIIGVFKDVELADGTTADLLKVVRDGSIGSFSWDTSSSDTNNGEGINEWSQADLMKMLNPGYETNTGELCMYDEELGEDVCSTVLVNNSLWWNSGNGNFYWAPNNYGGTDKLDYTGLSSNVHNKIESVVWNLGGFDGNDVYPNIIYQYERGTWVMEEPADGIERSTTWTGRVALMYPSDIGYAVDFNWCDVNFEYYEADCYDNNYFSDYYSYLLTPFPSETGIFGLDGGYVDYEWTVPWSSAVMPTFYLKSDTIITSGNGSKTNPYKVG